jgi:exopolysaccharide production protein ExoY
MESRFEAEAPLQTAHGVPGAEPFPAPATLVLKRLFDVLGALLLLLAFSPLMLATALAVWSSSPGPIVFRQRRIGQNCHPFWFLKFRSMRTDADREVGEQSTAPHARAGSLIKLARDPRITRIGAIIRRLSLDELPQLFNVLAGEMSLVGPRPLIAFMLEPYPELMQARSRVKPGLTGLWQIRCREKNESALDMMAHDLEYVSNCGLWLDLRILIATIPVVLSTRGAV